MDLTALEIAILRHDDLEIINKLIEKGAEVPSEKRINDLLSFEYNDVRDIIKIMTGNEAQYNKKIPNITDRFTIPTKEQFEENKKTILERFEAKENTYLGRVANVYKTMFETVKELWDDKEEVLGKIAAVAIFPFVIVQMIVMTLFVPILAISDGFSNENYNKHEPSSNLRSNNVCRSQENLHTRTPEDKNKSPAIGRI